MNYKEYNNQIKLSDDLYEKTLTSVKSEVSKHNQIQRRKKYAYLSFAACFVILVSSFSTVKYFNNNSSADVSESTNYTPTKNPDASAKNDINIIIETGDMKYPHKIILDNKIYSQYYFGDAKGDTNNNIVLKQSDIGEMICELDYSNLTDDLSTFAPITAEMAKNNKFYKAKVYKYAKSKSDNLIIVQVSKEYYIFYLNGLTAEYTVRDLLDVYTAKGANKITGIEVWQNELYDYTIELPEYEDITGQDVRPLLIGTVKDKDTILSIVNLLMNNSKVTSNSDVSDYLYDYENGLSQNKLMSEYGMYELHLVFADGQELKLDKNSLSISLQKGLYYFNICNSGDTYYLLEDDDYNRIVKLIESSLS